MGEKQLLRTITIVNYPKQVMTSKSIRAKYYKPKDKLLLKYLGSEIIPKEQSPSRYGKDRKSVFRFLADGYIWKNNRLHHVPTKTDIIKNTNQVGKERWIEVSKYYENENEFVKGSIVKGLKAFWVEQLNHTYPSTSQNLVTMTPAVFSLEASHYPVFIHLNYNARIPDNADLDNYNLPYQKTLLDSLVKVGILGNDTIKYIDDIRYSYTPIEENNVQSWGDSAQDKITIKIYGNTN